MYPLLPFLGLAPLPLPRQPLPHVLLCLSPLTTRNSTYERKHDSCFLSGLSGLTWWSLDPSISLQTTRFLYSRVLCVGLLRMSTALALSLIPAGTCFAQAMAQTAPYLLLRLGPNMPEPGLALDRGSAHMATTVAPHLILQLDEWVKSCGKPGWAERSLVEQPFSPFGIYFEVLW